MVGLELKFSYSDEAIQKAANRLSKKNIDRAAQKAIFSFGRRLKPRLAAVTPVDSGLAAGSWKGPYAITGGAEMRNPVPYAWYLEYGSGEGKKPENPWPSIGPRTVWGYSEYDDMGLGVRIMSSQAPHGVFGPALRAMGKTATIVNWIAKDVMARL